MRPFLLLLSFGFGVSTSFAQPTEPETVPTRTIAAPKPRVGAPEQLLKDDITSFIKGLNTGSSFFQPQTYIADARMGYFGAVDWFDEWKQERKHIQIVVSDITIDKIQGNDATATVSFRLQPPNTPPRPERQPIQEKLTLKYLPGETLVSKQVWQIVPPKEKTERVVDETSTYLSSMVYELAQQDWKYTADARALRSMLRLKNLALGVAQLTQDFDEWIAFAPEHLKVALKPYIPDEKTFSNPETGEAYAFNGNLSGKLLADVKEPTRTVLFYEGEDEKPKYRYDGKAVICFLDGHVQLITPDEAANLIWKL